jgi:hypothetical protein
METANAMLWSTDDAAKQAKSQADDVMAPPS